MDPAITGQTPVSLNDLLADASKAMAARKLSTAELVLKRAMVLAPDSAKAYRLAGVVQLMRGNPGMALEYLRRAVELKPDDFNAHMNLGSALFQCQYTDAALASMRHACELAPNEADPWYNLGRALQIARHTEEARPALERAMALNPTSLATRITLANILNSMGDIAKAATLYRSILQNHPDHARAWFELSDLKTEKLDDAEIQHISNLLTQPNLSADDRVWLGYALAKGLDDRGDLSAAFNALQTANAIKRRYITWDIVEEHQRIDGIIETFSQPLPLPLDPSLGKEVIFIACMPRSGSTLTEHILASHSMVEGANEIPDLVAVIRGESERLRQPLTHWALHATAEDWYRLGHEYLDRTAHWRKNKPRFTDKNLNNWALIGPALAMLPGARVVNTRRDPLETCFACYRQLFSEGAPFSYDFESMAHYFAGYDHISRFWEERFAENYRSHSYEEMLSDPEGSIRELLAFCRLPFEPGCLAFHKTSRAVRSTASAAQVRQPLQSNTARAPRYGALLDPLRDQLRQLGISIQG